MDDLLVRECPDCSQRMEPIQHRGSIAWRCPDCGRAELSPELTVAG